LGCFDNFSQKLSCLLHLGQLLHASEYARYLRTLMPENYVTRHSRAYITKTASDFFIGPPGDVVPREAEYGFLTFEDGIIDAGKEPAEQTICFFPKDGECELAEFSQRFYNSQLKAYIFGFIEYETMGTTWHRDFRYEWATSQEGIFFNLFGCDHPTTDQGRITSGHWRQSYSSNVEYLIPGNPEEEFKPN
jgi:hypothetical protein